MGIRQHRRNRQLRSLRRRRLVLERLDQRRVLAAITGTVFDDANHSLVQDDGEAGVQNRIVYLDSNNDGQLDAGESFALTGSSGQFSFSSLSDGSYVVRLFNGTSSQQQTFPIEASSAAQTVLVAGAIQLDVLGSEQVAVGTDTGIVIGDLASGGSQSINVGDQLTRMERLPDGNLLAIGTDSNGDTAWIVDPATSGVTPTNLADSDPPTQWATVAIDGSGRGVAVESASGKLFSIDATGPTVTATDTLQTIAADSQALASTSGVQTALAFPDSSGLQVRFWSNATGSFITDSIPLPGTSELLAFDETAGVLAIRNDSGGVNLYDADNIQDENTGLPPLHVMNDLTGPVTIDGTRDLLFTVSPLEAALKIIDLQSGDIVADLAIDVSEIGQVAAVALGEHDDSVVILGAAGVTEVALRKPAAHEIVIADDQDADPVLFGVALSGGNSAPQYSEQPAFELAEDSVLELSAPDALVESSDPDNDSFVLIQTGPAANGTGSVEVDGSLRYHPDENYFGTDTIPFQLHDSRDASDSFLLAITVTPVADPPTDIDVIVSPVPENLPTGTPIGTIEVIDVDGQVHPIEIDDPRFGHADGEIVYLGGGLDYETEPQIPLIITASDEDAGASIEEPVALTITDADDPVTEITLTGRFIDENSPGAVVGELTVFDQDAEQVHLLTVDDERFEVDELVLKLRGAEEVNYETEPTILINVTAQALTAGGTLAGDPYTQQFTITVNDEPEQPQVMDLTNHSVVEFEPGAIVGDVTLDSSTSVGNYEFTVDDPRFEFDGATLKLKDSEFVIRYQQQEIQVEVTGEDTSGQFSGLQETFVVEVIVNELPYHNEENPYDVDGDGEPSAQDALVIINWMGDYGPGPIGGGDPGYGYDVNGDGQVTALDALLVINELNRINTVGGTVGNPEAEGEQDDNPPENAQRLTQAQPAGRSLPEDDVSQQPVSSLDAPLTLKLVDISMTDRTVGDPDDIEIPDASSRNKFAQHVDHTLRLLSQRDA